MSTTTTPDHRRRPGYSLTVVLLFLVLIFSLWAAVYRTTASLLRTETAREARNDLDQGPLGALGQALWYLERNPSLARTAASYQISVPADGLHPAGQTFKATFTPDLMSTKGWTIQVVPGTDPTPLP